MTPAASRGVAIRASLRHAMSTVLSAMLMLAGANVDKVSAAEDIEFVAEHLPEVAMDNRFATLPVWSSAGDATRSWSFAGQAGYARTSTGNLDMDGSMWAVAVSRNLSHRWSAGAFVFYDRLNLSGNGDGQPLQTLFSPDTPISRPVMAEFDGLDGTVRHYGGGLRLSMASNRGWLGQHHWVGGLLWQRVELRDYRLTYRLWKGLKSVSPARSISTTTMPMSLLLWVWSCRASARCSRNVCSGRLAKKVSIRIGY